jgi:hypothetical protein
VPISSDWQKFIGEYAADSVYWYFPKGGTADTDDFREKFRAFRAFEGENWTPDLQRMIATDWRRKRISRGGSALPRQIKRVFENMGLCWIVEDQPVRVTPSGKGYIAEPAGRSRTLDQQVWRYQLPNPMNASSTNERHRAFSARLLRRGYARLRWPHYRARIRPVHFAGSRTG